ncbi:uncharacterized protein MELLADRAFT_112973 [Melampsora larici-populina 98AG31]|uniref:G protein-coupled receptor n=1 Tax=Melampsora larici-populina (strain 98AG31 / pathotype 3-4-7) TaxID=747676 RepID=F4S8A5_MELLP|nr:uncharacterized protein MELLADRAFT_112973 [Melampsora larici-populina 98AG31]EGF99122.1 hypothetical protein MELLADRAFT_112973 [Melampsora larici-populina 98AG31]
MTFMCLALWFIPALIVIFISAESELEELRAVLKAITSDLRHQGAMANMENYRRMDLLVRLIPARQLVVHRDRMARLFRLSMMIGITDLSVLSLIYGPLLAISIGTIRKKTSECTFAIATCTAERSIQFKRIERRLAKEHQTLLQHALAAYGSTLIFIPVIAWQLSYKGTTFMQNKKWLILTQIVSLSGTGLLSAVGIHTDNSLLPGNARSFRHWREHVESSFSRNRAIIDCKLTSNMISSIGFLLNQQAKRLLETHRAVTEACLGSSKDKESYESSCPTD